MSVSEVQALCEDPQASVSPLLCLSQSSHSDFLQPIKVQIPLPPGVTGIRSKILLILLETTGPFTPELLGLD